MVLIASLGNQSKRRKNLRIFTQENFDYHKLYINFGLSNLTAPTYLIFAWTIKASWVEIDREFISIYLSIYLSIYVYSYLSIYRSIYLCLLIPLPLSLCIHIYLYLFISIYLSMYLSMSNHIYLSIYVTCAHSKGINPSLLAK